MSVMLGAFMAVLDIQITNSSLKDIQGALSATLEEGSWISTSYLVAEIIMIPPHRLAGAVALGTAPGGVGVGGVPDRLADVFHGLEPGKHDRVPRPAGVYRRRADPASVHPDPDQAARAPPRQRHGDVCHDRHLRAVHRPDHRRLAHGKLGLGIHLLHQRAARAADDRRAALRPGKKAPHWELLKAPTTPASSASPSAWAVCRCFWKKATARTGSNRT